MYFDPEALYTALDPKRRKRGLSWAGLARELGVSDQVLHRLGRGQTPTVEMLIKLTGWLGRPGDLRPYLTDSPRPRMPSPAPRRRSARSRPSGSTS